MIKVNPNTANANTIPTCEPLRFKSSGSDDKNAKVLTGEIVLMDASGETLLTTRRKRLSLGDNWVVYDKETEVTPCLRATKHVNILKNKCLTHMTSVNNRSGKVSYNHSFTFWEDSSSSFFDSAANRSHIASFSSHPVLQDLSMGKLAYISPSSPARNFLIRIDSRQPTD
ncbi:hypothetical protein TB2_013287 [Malus domestica]